MHRPRAASGRLDDQAHGRAASSGRSHRPKDVLKCRPPRCGYQQNFSCRCGRRCMERCTDSIATRPVGDRTPCHWLARHHAIPKLLRMCPKAEARRQAARRSGGSCSGRSADALQAYRIANLDTGRVGPPCMHHIVERNLLALPTSPRLVQILAPLGIDELALCAAYASPSAAFHHCLSQRRRTEDVPFWSGASDRQAAIVPIAGRCALPMGHATPAWSSSLGAMSPVSENALWSSHAAPATNHSPAGASFARGCSDEIPWPSCALPWASSRDLGADYRRPSSPWEGGGRNASTHSCCQ